MFDEPMASPSGVEMTNERIGRWRDDLDEEERGAVAEDGEGPIGDSASDNEGDDDALWNRPLLDVDGDSWLRERRVLVGLKARLRLLWMALQGLAQLNVILTAAWGLLCCNPVLLIGPSLLVLPLAAHFAANCLVLLLLAHAQEIRRAERPQNQVQFQRLLRLRNGDMDDKLPRISRRFAVGAALVTSAFDVILLSTMGYGVTTLRHFLTAMSTLCAVAYWRTRSYLWLVTARGRADLVEGRDAQEPGLYECSHEGLGKATSKAAWRWAVACGGCAAAALIITSRSYVTTLMLSPEDGGHEKCDPLDATLCVTPWPSSYYLTADSSTPTGWILDLADKSLPLLKSGKHLSPASINKLDGFSTLGPALFYLEGMSAAGLARPHDLGSSLADDSLTVLYDTKSMERIPHFVDLDTTDASHPLAVLQPARPLQHNTRYVVAVKGVKGQGGEVLRPTPGFQQLLDAVTADKHVPLDIELRQRAEHFIAAVLPFIPVSTPSDNQSLYDDELQLAWDFTTASERSQLGLLKQMREHMESVDIPYRVVKVEEEREAWDEGLAGRTVWGRMTVPAYVDTEDRRGGVVVERGGDMDGKTKTFEVGFVMVVPGTVLSGDVAVEAIVQYGHGLFSTREEVKDDFLRDLSEAHGWILSATDWRGMSKHDLPTVAGILMRHTSDLHVITDNLMQSFINQEALLRLLTEKWREIAGLEDKGDEEDEGGTSRKSNRMRSASAPQILGQAERDQDDEGTVAGRSGMLGQPAAVDSQKPDAVAATGEGIQQEPPHVFYGISEGGVFGAGYSAFSTLLTRSVLSVSGTPFCLLLPRSRDFIVYRALLQLSLHGARDIQLVLALMQLFFDTVEAAGWRAAPVTPQALERHVLLQAGLGDAEVTTIGAEILARAYGAVAVNPPWDYPVWGVPESKDEGEQKDEGEHMGDEGEQEGGGACSAAVLAIYDYVSEAATVPEEDRAPPPNSVHFCVRGDPDAEAQVAHFVRTGCAKNFCPTRHGKQGCIRQQCH